MTNSAHASSMTPCVIRLAPDDSTPHTYQLLVRHVLHSNWLGPFPLTFDDPQQAHIWLATNAETEDWGASEQALTEGRHVDAWGNLEVWEAIASVLSHTWPPLAVTTDAPAKVSGPYTRREIWGVGAIWSKDSGLGLDGPVVSVTLLEHEANIVGIEVDTVADGRIVLDPVGQGWAPGHVNFVEDDDQGWPYIHDGAFEDYGNWIELTTSQGDFVVAELVPRDASWLSGYCDWLPADALEALVRAEHFRSRNLGPESDHPSTDSVEQCEVRMLPGSTTVSQIVYSLRTAAGIEPTCQWENGEWNPFEEGIESHLVEPGVARIVQWLAPVSADVLAFLVGPGHAIINYDAVPGEIQQMMEGLGEQYGGGAPARLGSFMSRDVDMTREELVKDLASLTWATW